MSTYSNLKIEEITLGDSGWGTTTTNNLLAIQQALQTATLATGDFTSNVATLPWTNTNATTNTPRAMVLNITATLTGAGTVNLPAITGGKAYLVVNGSSGGFAVTVKVTGLTGVSVPNGKSMWLWNNGTDVVDATNYISSLSLGAALPLTSGGTGQTTANAAFNALAPSQASASGKYLKSDGTNTAWDQIDISTADITGTLPVANGGTGVTTSTGTGSVVLSNSPTLVTPTLGTPASGTMTNVTGLPLTTGVTGTLPVANGGTGVTSSTGTGSVVLSNSPTLVTPALGTPASGDFSTGTFTWPTFNQNTSGTAAGLSATLAIASGGTGASTASGARTNLGATTLGGNLFTIANPSAVTFPQFNADNTVSSLDAASFRTAIGAGTGTGTVTAVTGTSPIASSGGTSPAISLSAAYGDTLNPYASKTANYFLAAPNGTAGAPTFRAIVAADIPTLNQNTTGTAGGLSGTLALTSGGTGSTTAAGARTNLGLGTMATQDDSNVGITGGTITAGISASTFSSGTISASAVYQRVTAIADGTSVTINADTTDIATQANTQAAGTLTINAPTGTIQNGQKLIFRLRSTNVQTFSWNAIFAGSTDLALPTASSGSSKYDYLGFIYNSTAAKWQLLAKNFGF